MDRASRWRNLTTALVSGQLCQRYGPTATCYRATLCGYMWQDRGGGGRALCFDVPLAEPARLRPKTTRRSRRQPARSGVLSPDRGTNCASRLHPGGRGGFNVSSGSRGYRHCHRAVVAGGSIHRRPGAGDEVHHRANRIPHGVGRSRSAGRLELRRRDAARATG